MSLKNKKATKKQKVQGKRRDKKQLLKKMVQDKKTKTE